MRATVMYGAGDVRIEDISDAHLIEATDALVGVTRAAICGSDLDVTIGGGPAPVRAYIEELLPDMLEGRIEPGRVFDRAIGLDEVPDGCWAMNDREAIKVLIEL